MAYPPENPGRPYGCFAALIISTISAFPLLFAWAWSGAHCEPVPQCQREVELNTALILSSVVAFAALVGFALNKLIGKIALGREDGGLSTGFILAAAVLTLLVTAAAVGLLYALVMIL